MDLILHIITTLSWKESHLCCQIPSVLVYKPMQSMQESEIKSTLIMLKMLYVLCAECIEYHAMPMS